MSNTVLYLKEFEIAYTKYLEASDFVSKQERTIAKIIVSSHMDYITGCSVDRLIEEILKNTLHYMPVKTKSLFVARRFIDIEKLHNDGNLHVDTGVVDDILYWLDYNMATGRRNSNGKIDCNHLPPRFN